MLETPSIISVHEQSAAIIRITVPQSDIRAVMPPAIKELRTTLAAQGIVPAGPMFTHHLSMDDAVFDFGRIPRRGSLGGDGAGTLRQPTGGNAGARDLPGWL